MNAVDELKDVAKSLRRLPVVEPELPTVRFLASGPGLSCISSCTILALNLQAHQCFPDSVPHASFSLQVALVGAPNVGKSSLVQLLSSGLPEVQNYPFTTRSIKMGHFYVAGRRHQVTGGPCQQSEEIYSDCLCCSQQQIGCTFFVASMVNLGL